MRLCKLIIQGFRGFNLKQEINLDNDIILFFGTNGSGKSSICESIEWLLYGEISRKLLAYAKGEYTGMHIKNAHFNTSNEDPFVELECIINSKPTKLKRVFKNTRNTECYINDAPVEGFETLEINLDNEFKPILSQIGMRALVDCTKEERWNTFSSMLGLEDLTLMSKTFQQAITALQNNGDYNNKVSNVKRFLNQLEVKTGYTALLDILKEQKDPLEFIINDLKLTFSEKEKCIEHLKKVSSEIYSKNKMPDFIDQAKVIIEPSSFDTNLTELFTQLIDSIKDLKKSSIDSEVLATQEKGYSLIDRKSLDNCPVCNKELTPGEKENIKDSIEQNKGVLQKRESYITRLNSFKRYIDEIIISANGIAEMALYESFLVDFVQLESTKEQAIKFKGLFDTYTEKMVVLTPKASSFLTSLKLFFVDNFEDNYTENIDTIQTLIKEITMIIEDFKILIGVFNKNLTEILNEAKTILQGQVSDDEKLLVEKAGFYLEAINIYNEIKYITIFESQLEQLKTLKDKSIEFEQNKASTLILSFSESIKDIYHQLNPAENIEFEELRQTVGAKNSVEFIASYDGQEINPITHFSEAHCNSLSLAVFLTQKVIRNNYFDFFILDDPVQSLDEQHAETLINLLKNFEPKKQMLIFTHSNKFEESFLLSFYGQNILHYKFDSYNVDGPSFDMESTNIETSLVNCKSLITNSCNNLSIKSAGNSLRITLEGTLKQILAFKNNKTIFHYSGKVWDLNRLTDEYNKCFSGNKWLGDLTKWRTDLNKDSHFNYTPAFKNTLFSYLEEIEKFYQDMYVSKTRVTEDVSI